MNEQKNAKRVHTGAFSHISRCFRLLSIRGRILYISILLAQSVTSILDLVGLALIVQLVIELQDSAGGQNSSVKQTSPFIERFYTGVDTDFLLVAVLTIFILKGVLSLILHSINVRVMVRETIDLVKKLSKLIFAFRTSSYKKLSSQDISYTLFTSTEMVFKDTLVPVSVIFSDSVLIFLIGINLLVSAQVLFLPTLAYFLFIFIALRMHEKTKTKYSYRIQWEKEIEGRARLHETLMSLRELFVSAKLNLMLNRVVDARGASVKAAAVVTLSQLRPKYFYEMALFGGIGIIASVAKISNNQDLILSFLVLFVISASRLIPSLMRIQYYLGTFQKSKEQTRSLFEILERNHLAEEDFPNLLNSPASWENKDIFSPEICVDNLSFSYDGSQLQPTLDKLNFKVAPGETIAIVGPSGSGKSTLIDVVLGYQSPDTGRVHVSGVEPRVCFSKWPGKVAYVPQKVVIYEGTLFDNIAVGVGITDLEENRHKVINLLEKVELRDFVLQQAKGIDCPISELGSNLSGGQAQRIGIARALFSNPEVLVLDETTSALDSTTEYAVMEYINSLRGKVTTVIVTHRLSTIKTCDQIYYLEQGRIIARGSFDEMRSALPDFEAQVKLLEL